MAVPNTYPPQPFAKVHIAWGVISVIPTQDFAYTITGGIQMADSEATYTTYQTISDAFFCDTDLTNYISDVPAAIHSVYNYFSSQVAKGYKCEIHWSITLANPTAANPPMGAYVQAKQHMDGHLTANNVQSELDLWTPLEDFIPFLQKIAKY